MIMKRKLSVLPLLALLLGVAAVKTWPLSNLLMTGTQASMAVADSVAMGVQRGMDECRVQFAWERWDCPQDAFTVFPRDRGKPATREMAFVHAIVSAGIMYTLTKNCSSGNFDACGCDKSKQGTVGPEGWSWGGCSDNTDFGEKMSSEFLDNQELGTDATALVNLHNNQVGRLAVKKTMKRLCKCHGVSGSCATKTCSMRLAEFREVGDYLKSAYKRAHKLQSNEDNVNNRGANPIQRDKMIPGKKRLVFTDNSPDFCRSNSTAGSTGMIGRSCSKKKGPGVTLAERKSCKHLCKECKLKVRKRSVVVVSSCNCKFQWCCEVQCEQCQKTVSHYMCT